MGGSKVAKLPNPASPPLYKCDIYSPFGTGKSQLHFQGPLVPFQILEQPSSAAGGLIREPVPQSLSLSALAFSIFILFSTGLFHFIAVTLPFFSATLNSLPLPLRPRPAWGGRDKSLGAPSPSRKVAGGEGKAESAPKTPSQLLR